MKNSEYDRLSTKLDKIEKTLARLAATMLPTEEGDSTVDQVMADTVGMSIDEKRAHYKRCFKGQA